MYPTVSHSLQSVCLSSVCQHYRSFFFTPGSEVLCSTVVHVLKTHLTCYVLAASLVNAFGSDFVIDGIDSDSDEADEEHAEHMHESGVSTEAPARHHTALSRNPTVTSVEAPQRVKIPLTVLALQTLRTTKSRRGNTWPMLWQVRYFTSGGLRDVGLVLSDQCLVCKGKRCMHTNAVAKNDSDTDPHGKCLVPVLLCLLATPFRRLSRIGNCHSVQCLSAGP